MTDSSLELNRRQRINLEEIAGLFIECACKDLSFDDVSSLRFLLSLEELSCALLSELVFNLSGLRKLEDQSRLCGEISSETAEETFRKCRAAGRLQPTQTVQLLNIMLEEHRQNQIGIQRYRHFYPADQIADLLMAPAA